MDFSTAIAQARENLWTVYKVRLSFRGQIRGGTPMNPALVPEWIRGVYGRTGKNEDILARTTQTLREMGIVLSDAATWDDIRAATDKLAIEQKGVGFKKDDEEGLYIEGRCVKAMLKESTAIACYEEAWGSRPYKSDPSRMTVGKDPRAFLAERVFVEPDKIYLNAVKPSGIDLFVGHPTDQRGNRISTLTYYEYMDRPTIEFEVHVWRNLVPEDKWPWIWAQAEKNGFGALRSQGFGRFLCSSFEPVGAIAKPAPEGRTRKRKQSELQPAA